MTGELVGLQANGTSAPTDVILFSGVADPHEGNNIETFSEPLPFDFNQYNPTQSGEFTLVNGSVTAIGSTGFQISENTLDQVTIDFVFGSGMNKVTETGTNSSFLAENGFGANGVFYSAGTPDVAAPEPSTYALALLGLGLLAMLKIRRQRSKA